MLFPSFFSILALLPVVAIAATFNQNTLNKFNDFVKTPSTQFAVQTGGRLIERHLSYLSQAGFKSLLSVVVFSTNDTVYNGVSGSFPSSDYEIQLAKANGIQATYYASSLTVDSAKAINDIILSLPKPLYIHCHVGWTANLFYQTHLYLNGYVTGEEIYSNGLLLGYDYQNNTDAVNMLNSLTGMSVQAGPEKIEQSLASGEYSYKYYYWTHRMGGNDYWYNAGQILSTHVDSIKTAGYKVIVNFREDNEPTGLLPGETLGVPTIQNWEFSDDKGYYHVSYEKEAFENAGFKYYHLSTNSSDANTWTKKTFYKYLPTLQQAAKEGPVVAHCASGYRSAAFVLTYLAYESKSCSDWVFKSASQIGFIYQNSNPTTTDLYIQSFVKEVLGC